MYVPALLKRTIFMGIYPHATSLYHERTKAERGIAMFSVDKFQHPRKQTRCNEFIPCSNNICQIVKRFRSFTTPAIPIFLPKSPYQRSVDGSYPSGKESGRHRHCDVIKDDPISLYLMLMTSNIRYAFKCHGFNQSAV